MIRDSKYPGARRGPGCARTCPRLAAHSHPGDNSPGDLRATWFLRRLDKPTVPPYTSSCQNSRSH
ncbi:hypothetical protein PAMC26577_01555 [Caballeronia sordidicola]|uniref:Uncharacterized protein n=1 Tax=Caballeronia sordidicola TaxID=196367 RepID=A0A242N840_CABSO|nr:hypothetical protein PAMC26577_01555 [Caballeronia sordidicola]